MSLTDVMDDVNYAQKNFNESEAVTQQPMWMTESHFVYHIQRSNNNGEYSFIKDLQGEPLCSPRPLKQLSMQPMVVRHSRMKILKGKNVSPDLYPVLLTEAIFQRSLQTVSYLVSTWPLTELHVRDVLPREDLERFQQLTEPFDNNTNATNTTTTTTTTTTTQETVAGGGMSLCDAFMAGLLNLPPGAPLRLVSFAGLGSDDRKLCRELLRLPILWIQPSHREADFIHSLLSQDIGISLEDVDRYLNRITNIYSGVDRYVKHGKDLGPVTVELDCRVTQDDVAIGLALQFRTPFTFRCARVWMDPATEFVVPVTVLRTVLQPQHITHLEVEDPDVSKIPSRWQDLNDTLPLLTSLRALSLPNTLHVELLQESFQQFSQTLLSLKNLRRVNLSSCTLRDSLQHVLRGLPAGGQAEDQGVTYLSLRDCRLTPGDIQHLLEWPQVSLLQELNLSRNNLQGTPLLQLKDLIHKLSATIVCLSLSYTSLAPADLQAVAQTCQLCCRQLKVLALQGFTPPLPADLHALLESCAAVPTLQRCLVFPEPYAFPGRHISQRAANRASVGLLCCELLSEVGRPDIQLA